MCIIPIRKTDRVALFIDNNNLKDCAGVNHINSRINYLELTSHLTSGRVLMYAKVYDSFRRNIDNSINYSLPNYLSGEGFTVCFRDSYDPGRKIQKEVDVDLATDLVLDAKMDLFDVAVLVSGDGDMIPAVEKAKSFGKTVEVASFEGGTSEKLKRLAMRHWNLSDAPIVELMNRPYPTDLYASEEAIADE